MPRMILKIWHKIKMMTFICNIKYVLRNINFVYLLDYSAEENVAVFITKDNERLKSIDKF